MNEAMSESNTMFERALRAKYKFPSSKGRNAASVEDLWDFTLEELNKSFKTLNADKRTTSEESLLDSKSKEEKELDAKIAIIKYIVETKKAEDKEKRDRAAALAQVREIDEILGRKDRETLEGKSPDELRRMRSTLLSGSAD